jgi:hypothetical protein
VPLQTNRSQLVISAVTGAVAPSLIGSGIYDVRFEGEALIVPSVGGITLNVRVGDSAFAFVADHIEPGVSARHEDDKINLSFTVLACVGNEAVVTSGEAKGATGRVTGKHGGVEHVMIDFPPETMKKMVIGDTIQVWGCGVGLKLKDAGDVKVFNADPDLLDAWGISVASGRVAARVAKIIPAAVMGSGLGRATVARGDYDIQTFDDATSEKYGLRDLRLGDIVAIVDADNSFGRIYRTGAISVGVVVHGSSFVAGHGPGVTTLLTSASGAIDVTVDERANLATILGLRGT